MEIKEYITTQTYSSFAIRYLCITMHMFATNSSILLLVNVRQWYTPTVYVTYIFSPMLFYSTRIGIFAILYLRSVFSKYPHSILISVLIVPTFHCQVMQYCWALPSTFYFYLLLSPSISYLLLLCTRPFIFYYVHVFTEMTATGCYLIYHIMRWLMAHMLWLKCSHCVRVWV